MRKLWHFEIVKIGQKLHANMEGFRKAGHILYSILLLIHLILKLIPLSFFGTPVLYAYNVHQDQHDVSWHELANYCFTILLL